MRSLIVVGLLALASLGCERDPCVDKRCVNPQYHCVATGSATATDNCGDPDDDGAMCCIKITTTTTTGGGTGGTTVVAYCNPGNTYNYSSRKCCPNSARYYYPGTHGITSAGCYASCPYVNDCGNMFTKY